MPSFPERNVSELVQFPLRRWLRDGGASRGNLLSGEADHCILTVSRMDEEKKANPGYRAFLANGVRGYADLSPIPGSTAVC